MTATIVLAQLVAEECVAELYVNGAPISRLDYRRGVTMENTAAEQWIIPGTNTVEVLVEPGSTPSLARYEERDLERKPIVAIARLIRFEDGARGTVESGQLLAEAKWEWTPDKPDTQRFPKSEKATVDLGAAHGAWAWQSAPVLTLDDALIAEARAVIDDLEAAIRGGHVDRLWNLTELQQRECLRAFPAVSEEFVKTELASMVQNFREGGDASFLVRDPAEHDFRLVCGGRLLELVDKDNQPSFRMVDPGTQQVSYFPTFVGRHGNELRVMRS